MKTIWLKLILLLVFVTGGVGNTDVAAQKQENSVTIKMVKIINGVTATEEKTFDLNDPAQKAAFEEFKKGENMPEIQMDVKAEEGGEIILQKTFTIDTLSMDGIEKQHRVIVEKLTEGDSNMIVELFLGKDGSLGNIELMRSDSMQIIVNTEDGLKTETQEIIVVSRIVLMEVSEEEDKKFEPESPKMKKLDEDIEVEVYPNPASEQLNIRAALPGKGNIQIELMDATGKIMQTISEESTEDGYTGTLNISGLQSGIYFIRLSRGKHYLVRKVMIEN